MQDKALNFTEVVLERLITHRIGNKHNEEDLIASKSELDVAEPVKDLLLTYFLSSFKSEAFYSFQHESDLSLNDVNAYVTNIFTNSDNFTDNSISIATFLYEKSEHPKIKSGQLYIALFKNCIIEDEIVDAIGIFKSENTDTYLKVYSKGENFDISADNGVNIKKLDKGCLIFNTESELGYKINIVDMVSRVGEASFWKDDFLNVKMRENNFYQTKNYLDVCKNFIKDVYNPQNDVERADQADLLNKTVKYFNENDTFKLDEFEQDVMMGESDMVESFKKYKNKYSDEFDINLADEFDISDEAVNKAKRNFKSVLKLDKNFHVYIHGDRNRIAKGFDNEKNMNYYQLYYEQEQ